MEKKGREANWINNKIIYEPRTIYWWHSTNIQEDVHLRQVIKKDKNEKKKKKKGGISLISLDRIYLKWALEILRSVRFVLTIRLTWQLYALPGHPEPDLYLATQNLIYECRNVHFSNTAIFKVTMRHAPQLFKMTIILLEGSHYSETLYTKGAYGQIHGIIPACTWFYRHNETYRSIL